MHSIRVVLLLLLLCIAKPSWSDDNDIKIDQAKARATFAFAKTGAVYLSLLNTGDKPDTLLAVIAPESLAMEAQLHTTVMADDIMQMREIEAGVLLAPKQRVEFKPGGKHIMLMGLKGPLNAGETIRLTLQFEHGAPQTIAVPVIDLSK